MQEKLFDSFSWRLPEEVMAFCAAHSDSIHKVHPI